MTRETILQSLVDFQLQEARCYDPNEEARLRSVMRAVGEERFVAPEGVFFRPKLLEHTGSFFFNFLS